jgi:methionyl-tRNA formyltransferase
MGSPEIAVPPLDALYNDSEFEIAAIISQPDKKKGRKQTLTSTAIKEYAIKKSIPVLTPTSIKNNKELEDLLIGLKPDLIVVTAYGKILPQSLLDIAKYGAINIHFSLLPIYRGASPVEEALINDDHETGITIIKMTEQLDAGDIIHIERVLIDKADTVKTLKEKLSQVAFLILPSVIKEYLKGNLTPIPQNEAKSTYTKKITKDMGLLDMHKVTAHEAYNLIRAYREWPTCYIQLPTKKLKIFDADYMDKNPINLESGQIAVVEKKKMAIGTRKGILYPKIVQLEGKKPMSIQDFLAGNLTLLKKELTNPT